MFGFHSYSENPFSTLTADGGGGSIQSGVALLEASGELFSSGSLYITSQYLLENSGSLTPGGSLYVSAQDILEGSGELDGNGSLYITSQVLLENSGTLAGNGSLYLSATNTLVGSGDLSSNGSLYLSSSNNLVGSGSLSANGTLIHGAGSTLQGSGAVGPNGTLIASGASLILDAGEITAYGTLIHGADSALEGTGTLDSASSLILGGQTSITGTGVLAADGGPGGGGPVVSSSATLSSYGVLASNGTLIHGVISALESSGTLGSNATLGLDGAVLNLDSGETVASGTLIHGGASTLQGSGTLVANGTAISSGVSLLSSSGVLTANGTLINVGSSSLVNSGELVSSGTVAIGGSLTVSGSGNVDGTISVLKSIQAVVGTTYDEFIYSSHRLNYKPALPRLHARDVALDFPFSEGGGNLFSASSRRQVGDIGGLTWGRTDGRQSLVYTGTNYLNNRIQVDTTGLDLERATLFFSFKPSSINTIRFLLNLRGTANNNNEIDIYIDNPGKLVTSIYDGTTLQNITTPNNYITLNQWNTVAITWDTTLKVYVNDNAPLSLSSFVEPSVLGSTLYIGGRVEDNSVFQGSMDHFRWYNRELRPVEISSLSKNMSQDYQLARLVPNHYQMSQIITGTPVLTHNISSTLVGSGVLSAYPWIGGVSLESSGVITANGVILNELDVVPFTTNINQVEDYTNNIYQIYAQTTNINRLHTKSFEK